MLGSCREVPEEDLPKPLWISAHVATTWEEALPTTSLEKSWDVTGHHTLRRHKKLCHAPSCSWNNQACKGTRETQILPPVLWDLLEVVIPPPHTSVPSEPFTATSNTLHSLESHKPHKANYLSLVICFASIPASRAMPTSRACSGTRRRVTQDWFSRD